MVNQTDTVYVFDLDGVITNPENSQVSEAVVDKMYDLLASGTYLVVNTGRSYNWVEQNLVSRLLAHDNADIFDRFITVCEKGGETVSWHDGVAAVLPSEFALPTESYDITRAIFDEHSAELQTMFWDDTKRTMATIEKLPAADLSTFHHEQAMLVDWLRDALAGHDVRIDPTTIATDVELPAAGKYAGAKLIFNWVGAVTGSPDHAFVSIGDSSSDYEMARYFAEQQVESIFVYVGKPTDKISHDSSVTFIETGALFSAGALEFLNRR